MHQAIVATHVQQSLRILTIQQLVRVIIAVMLDISSAVIAVSTTIQIQATTGTQVLGVDVASDVLLVHVYVQ
jgi:multisubunit Na+/H+ antiporter MnhE subunit